ncbi:MAG: 50S ribosomal protein L5 [Nanoarchaeota archaeon]
MTNHPPKPKSQNHLRKITIAKVTLNLGAGKNEDLLKRGLVLLQKLVPEQAPVKTMTHKRIPGWGLRPGLAIGAKVTVRRNTKEFLKRLLAAKQNMLASSNFDRSGNVSFGIPEYIDIPGLEYDPDLKILGLEVAVTLERPGFRVKQRRQRPSFIGKAQRISQQEAISFIESLGVQIS